MIFRRDVKDPEGPVCLPDGSWAITEMGRGVISRISEDGMEKTVIAHTGRPNGLALDSDGDLWIAESLTPALLKLSQDGSLSTITTGSGTLPFLWPNDLCFGPDGALYMTDSGILIHDENGEQRTDSLYDQRIDGRVFRIDPVDGKCSVLDRGLRFANGIAFGPGLTDLYVSETLTGNIYRYRVEDGELAAQRHLFGNVMKNQIDPTGPVAVPDGMAFDVQGNLYVGVLEQGDVTVLAPDGSVKVRIPVDGTFPTNVAFFGAGEHQIMVTEGSKNQLLLMDTTEAGLELFT